MTTFEELQAAVNAGGTVKLGGNIALENYLDIQASTPLVLDLNGHTITGSDYGVWLRSGTCTIQGGSITSKTFAVSNSGGTLTIDQCTISSDSIALYSNDPLAVTTVRNSTLISADHVISCDTGTVSLEGTVNLSGTIYGPVTLLSGTYNFDPSLYYNMSTSGWCYDNGDGTWTVTAK